jgi:hypothetical protein
VARALATASRLGVLLLFHLWGLSGRLRGKRGAAPEGADRSTWRGAPVETGVFESY